MFRPLSIFIGTRYISAKRRNRFISFISMTSMIGLALGVLAMIVVLSIMNGFQREMRIRVLGIVPHAIIIGVNPINDWRPVAKAALKNLQVTAAVPFTQIDGMFSYRGMMQPIEISGVDPAQESTVSNVVQHIVRGKLEDLKPGEFGVVISDITARRFRLNIGDKLIFIVPEISTVLGGIVPHLQRLSVVGIFDVSTELYGSIALINIADAAVMRHWQSGQVQSVRLALKDIYLAPKVSRDIVARLGTGYMSDDWTHTQNSLFSAMKMEKTMIGLLLLMIIVVAAFNIIATLSMVVNDKSTDIAVLCTIGATPRQIMAIFMVQGTVIGTVGVLIGSLLGVITALNLSQLESWLESVTGQHIFSSGVYLVSNLPSELQGSDVLLICTVGFVLSFIATIYPAYIAAKIEPAHALRYF
ncbi:lipoprotein-releasing ABC transporter permease subunit [Candidatus Pseudomonas adelgestsugas]|nr:lipoprotein-releasing ABC transporter permease subunit [Candidatus Pseudomonas adelgestsugas]